MNLYFLNYNNYYNRIVKRENTLSDYLEYQVGEPVQGVTNWNPKDGVSTEQILNSWNYPTPDYMLAVNEEGEIDSRWFVIEAEYLRNSQYRIQLYRDVIVDNYDTVINAPCFIEKATPQSIRDPAIYNNEDMTFNQIKTGEQLLFDETHCPWIVGYIPRNAFNTNQTVKVETQLTGSADITVEHLSDYPFYQYANTIVSGQVTNPTIKIALTYWLMHRELSGSFTNYYYNNTISLNQNGNYIGKADGNKISKLLGYYWMQTNTNSLYVPRNNFTDEYARQVVANMTSLASDFQQKLSDYVDSSLTPEQFAQLEKDKNKIIYETATGQYWKITLTGSSSGSASTSIGWDSDLGVKMRHAMVTSFGDGYKLVNPVVPENSPFSFTSDTAYQKLTFEPEEVNLSVQVPATRYHASETPYDIFCMPYSNNLTIKKSGVTYVNKTNASAALTLAQQIAAQVGKDNIYDIQLLPYCPVRYCIMDDGSFDIGSAIYSDVKAGDDTVSVLLWATTDNFELNIPIKIPEEQTVLNKKIKNETEFIRIVAPNFSNSFQFDPQMNEGMDYVTVLCHYKPFNPYIKIQPNFKGLYGSNFNDSRGLVCNGDFSLAQVTSAWADYELQNKNYQNIFNREIQNLQVTNSVQRTREVVGAITGGLSGAVGGAAAGAMVGGLGGAIAGGLAGGLASGLGARKDIELNDKLRNEALDYKRDMFGYNLQNIQALPQGLAKTSAISPDNKYVPFIEYYECTDAERQALQDKLTYNGYTIMRIGSIANYLQQSKSYIKGRIIRMEAISEDFDMLTAIADEIYKGVFI